VVGAKHVRLAWVDSSGKPMATTSYEVAQFTTLTESLMRFERESGVPLTGARCAISICGATHGEVMAIARGRWTVSRSGLASIFQRPVAVLNEVAASAWSLLSPRAGPLAPIAAARMPDFTQPGRWVVASIDTGVGLAGIDVDGEGRVRMLECEMGHCGFSPEDAQEDALLRALRTPGRTVSWEHVLMLPLDSPVWSAPGLPTARAARAELWAALAGAFAGDAVLALGAWRGAILTGSQSPPLASHTAMAAFNARFERQPSFERLLRATPRWRMSAPDPWLTGLGVALIQEMPAAGGEKLPEAPPVLFPVG
jgi:glucokinase